MLLLAALALAGAGAAFLYWRRVWFFRNPPRTPPATDGLLSPADGTVVYVKTVEPHADVITIKQGVRATLKDLLRQDESSPKLVIGIFMSPFNVHYNRAPLAGKVESIRHHPAIGKNVLMRAMHFRTLARWHPRYRNSLHIIQNERKVTRISGRHNGAELGCYVVQIAGRSVNGIDSYMREGESVARGALIGMIRIGSQVDLVVPGRDGLRVRVSPGDRVRAGETILID